MKTDELINKENGKALVLHIEINRLARRMGKLAREINAKKAQIQEVCIHNGEKKTIETYVDGSYLNKAEYITTVTCLICDKELDKQVKYGGFC